jgi:hypothetical protein
LFLASDYALYAELFRRKGRSLQAKQKLGEATNLFRDCRADGWLKKAEKELAALSRKVNSGHVRSKDCTDSESQDLALGVRPMIPGNAQL